MRPSRTNCFSPQSSTRMNQSSYVVNEEQSWNGSEGVLPIQVQIQISNKGKITAKTFDNTLSKTTVGGMKQAMQKGAPEQNPKHMNGKG